MTQDLRVILDPAVIATAWDLAANSDCDVRNWLLDLGKMLSAADRERLPGAMQDELAAIGGPVPARTPALTPGDLREIAGRDGERSRP